MGDRGDMNGTRRVTRRALLGGVTGVAGAAILAACGADSRGIQAGEVTGAAGTGVATAAAVQANETRRAGTAQGGTPIGAAGAMTNSGTPTSGTPNPGSTPAAGTAQAQGTALSGPYTGKKLNVALVLNGQLGDKSFFDSAQRGMDRAKAELGSTVRTIELSTDQNRWQPGLTDAAAGNYDLVICGTFDMVKPLSEIAPTQPNKRFVFFDQAVDYTKSGFTNVYSVLFRQNEGSYLLGYAAGLLVQSTNADVQRLTGGGKKLGFLGGSRQPVIEDFLIGFRQGAKDAGLNPMSDVLVSYVEGSNPFSDPAKGKELSLAMYGQGAGIGYGVAGGSGLGLLEAGAQQKRLTLGVDSDQYELLKTSKPDQAQYIVTSMLKRVDNGLFRAVRLAGDNSLKYGTVEAIGLRDGGVELADNENYKKIVPQDIRDKVAARSKEIAAGTFMVETVIK